MMLKKLMQTLATSMAPAAMRNAAISASTQRSKVACIIKIPHPEALGAKRRASKDVGPGASASSFEARAARGRLRMRFRICASESVLRRRVADHLQHVVHGGLALGDVVGDGCEQRLQLGEVVGGQLVHRAAERGPIAFQFLGE